MRTPSSIGRYLLVASVSFAAVVAVGGAFFVGYVGEVQRGLSDPPAQNVETLKATAALEQALGYEGFLKSYRAYRLTGDPERRAELNRNVANARGALTALQKLYGAKAEPVREIASIAGAFIHVANTAPAISTDVLRGTAAMEDLNALPQAPQLEATYLSLRNALDGLRRADERRALGGVSSALNWSQGLIVASLALTALLVLAAAYLFRARTAGEQPQEQKPWDTAGAEGFARRVSSDVSLATQTLKSTVADLSRQQAEGVEATRTALHDEVESLRGEIRDLAVRLTEDRILDGGAAHFAPKAEGIELKSRKPQRSLADVPADEIMARLKNLAAEMTEAQDTLDQVAALKNALGAFAEEIKEIVPAKGREQALTAIGAALHHHADEIEAHAGAIEPKATALRNEVRSITDELRKIAARAETGTPKDNANLRDAAIQLGARAESLFTYLEQTHPEEDAEPAAPAADETAGDIAALSELIARMEKRARELSERAVAARFTDMTGDWSADREQTWKQADQRTDAAIKALFQSIDRLNNVAAALARAGDAERHRRTAH